MTKPTYSIDAPDQQRLKVARIEIEAILKKHDLAGAVTLHTPGMSEFFYDIRPSYSCAWIDEAAGILRVKSKLVDYGGDVQRQQMEQACTAQMLHSMADDLASAAKMFNDCSRVVDRVTRSEHSRGEHVPDPMEAKKQ